MHASLKRLIRSTPLIYRLVGSTRRFLSREPLRAPVMSAGQPVDWAQARPGIAAPSGLCFRDIQVVPSTRLYHRALMFDGGPVWPAFADTPIVRHKRHGELVDVNASPAATAGPVLFDEAVWGGRCFFHFGHLVAEHISRLPAGLYGQPRLPVLFSLPPGKTAADVPGFFWSVTAWLGLPRDRIHFITRPGIVSQLHVYPQAETLGPDAPPDWYIHLLDELSQLNRLEPIQSEVLYVHRLGEARRGNGCNPGESALVAALARAGVAIMDPGKESLERQMAFYAGAKLLIFAEGSAMHGRQLLGRVDQKILVLRRRPHSTLARAHLIARCRELEYAPIIKAFAQPHRADGSPIPVRGVAFYNVGALHSILAKHGIDIRTHWRPAEYRAAALGDARAWLHEIQSRPEVDRKSTMQHVRVAFQRADFSEALNGKK
ncbi:glycosyltransferase family 61 protein [Paracoccus sp. TOH]|uniref:glycosyltransferase family 61 protein n=1 Tax=Paracoccus sp. TOH TaxID=1263728 RepID=UPI0025AFF6E5|nr:glycosyltransferase family 61 protein [Paracoccus sp. TOH]WJS84678.1 glycosyltransferase family 61 protein [Paracoccus sp. TOH]